eukprot:2972386-Rhodomonas_salina.1
MVSAGSSWPAIGDYSTSIPSHTSVRWGRTACSNLCSWDSLRVRLSAKNGHRHELDDTSSENGDNAAIRTNSEAQPTSHDQAGNFNRRPPSDKLPAASLWIRDGLLQKRVTGNGNTTWQVRLFVTPARSPTA